MVSDYSTETAIEDKRIVFKESEQDTLHLSDEPYYMKRSSADGEKDLVQLANSDIREEGCWLFSHDRSEWYNLRMSHPTEESSRFTGILAKIRPVNIKTMGDRLTMYHIHSRNSTDEQFRILWDNVYIQEGLPGKTKDYIDLQRRLCHAQTDFVIALPSEEDIRTFLGALAVAGDSELDFKIESPLGITTVTINTHHPMLEAAVNSFPAFRKRQGALPMRAGKALLHSLDQVCEGQQLHIKIPMDAIHISIDVNTHYRVACGVDSKQFGEDAR